MFDPSTSEDVGRTIPTAGGNRESVAAMMAWSDDISIQGGPGGVVFVREPAEGQPASYRTAFVEAFPGGTFIRGEGATVSEAERACWDRYQRWLHCPGPTGEHSWKPGCTAGSGKWIAYRNGAGFCEHCNAFESGRFTAEAGPPPHRSSQHQSCQSSGPTSRSDRTQIHR